MAFGPVPHSAIRRYADQSGVTGEEDFACFLACIRAMDNQWLDHQDSGAGGEPKVANEEMTEDTLYSILG